MFDQEDFTLLNLTINLNHCVFLYKICSCVLLITEFLMIFHLWEKHKVSKKMCMSLILYIHSLQLVNLTELSLLSKEESAHLCLKIYHTYSCKLCDYTSTSLNCISCHLSHMHSKRSECYFEKYYNTSLWQLWISSYAFQSWKVENTAVVTSLSTNSLSIHLQKIHKQKRARIAEDCE